MEDVFPRGALAGRDAATTQHDRGAGHCHLRVALVGTGIAIQVVFGLVMKHFADQEHRLDSLYPSRIAIDVDQFPTPRVQENPQSTWPG